MIGSPPTSICLIGAGRFRAPAQACGTTALAKPHLPERVSSGFG